MTRVNFSPGQYRDLEKPLVEIDSEASRHVRTGQRILGIGLWTFIVVGVVFHALFLLGFLIVLVVDG